MRRERVFLLLSARFRRWPGLSASSFFFFLFDTINRRLHSRAQPRPTPTSPYLEFLTLRGRRGSKIDSPGLGRGRNDTSSSTREREKWALQQDLVERRGPPPPFSFPGSEGEKKQSLFLPASSVLLPTSPSVFQGAFCSFDSPLGGRSAWAGAGVPEGR